MKLSTGRPLLLLFICALIFSYKGFAQVEFIQNKGQWDNRVNYKADFTTGSFFLEKGGFTILLNKSADVQRLADVIHGHTGGPKELVTDSFTVHSVAYKVRFLGANPNPKAIPDKPLPTYNNYFIGNKPSEWASDCKVYTAVTYKDIYPNIDVRYYSTNDQLKYDLIVRPGGNPAQIAMRYDGVEGLTVKNKELIIQTAVGDVKELPPYSYQTNVSGNNEVNTKYFVRDNLVTFDVMKFDPKATLVIDPQIIFSSFTGSSADNWGYTATPGPDGSFFAGGIVFASGYPVSPGAFQTTYNGGTPEGSFPGIDMGIFKFSPNGSTRLYATYIGGHNGNEQPHSMITDPQGNLIIAGRSSSSDYPELTPLNLRSSNYDIVVTKLNAAGTALIGSVRLGGSGNDGVNIRPKYIAPQGADRLRRNYGDDARSEVIIDAANNIYVSSCTQSSDFNGMAGTPIQPVFGGSQDGVILKFNPNLSAVLFQTYFGGAGDDACFVAAIDPVSGNLYVGGATSSTTLPGSTAGTVQAGNAGGIDGFVTIVRPDGLGVIKTTYLGTGGIDLVYGLKFDRLGNPYVMGTTTGSWPVLNAPYSVPGSKQFISKLQPDLSAFVYSTVFGTSGSSPNISPIAFLVDRCENVYVSGWGGGINVDQGYSTGTTFGLPEVNPLPGIPPADGRDFYFFVLKKDAQNQLFGSHFGQNGGLGDHVDGGTSRFDANGIIYQAICANCNTGYKSPTPIPFPVTAGVWSTRNESVSCNEAAVKIDMNFAGIGAEIQSDINGDVTDSVGCIPLTVNFKDLQAKGVTYYWNFNSTAFPNAVDQTTTVPQTSFTFTTVGTYRVRLISEDLNTCNLRDTSYITIRAGDNQVMPSFTKIKLGPCTSNQYQFTNTTTATGTPSFDAQSFVWDYGDGSPKDTAGLNPPRIHNFPGPGTYIVKLIVIDIDFCNAPDTLSDTLRINSIVEAKFDPPAIGCVPYSVTFKNTSLAGLTWLWDFGDPASGANNTSTQFQPTHVYQNIGTYKVVLTAFDPTTCNLMDVSDTVIVTVLPKPTASADWRPNPPEPNVPVTFINNAQNADHYLWFFGDGETSTETAPVHEYNATGNYNAYQVAINRAGCTDTSFLIVSVIVNPLLDVPNAFTPGRFGVNGTVSVRGFGIDKMDWKIYNRWGQLVFRSESKKAGWDGYYKGVLQPTDVYTYSLDVQFTDGKKLRKTGDITLIR